jgi:hypothetical protein
VSAITDPALDATVAAAPAAVDGEAQLSTRFLQELGVYTRRVQPQWQLCATARVPSDVFSKLVRGHLPIRPGDRRITRVGAVLGLEPHECFED